MKNASRHEYKSITVRTNQSWVGARGTVDTESFDEELNEMARGGWRLHSVESLEHTSGTNVLLCIFEREVR